MAPTARYRRLEPRSERLTYEQVAMWAKNLRTETTGRTAKAVTEDDSDFMGNFEEELTDIADGIVDRIVESNLDRIPNMFARALNRRLRDGSVRGAFHV